MEILSLDGAVVTPNRVGGRRSVWRWRRGGTHVVSGPLLGAGHAHPCRGGLVTVSKYLREERLASEVKQGAMIQISGIGAGGEAPGH